MQNYRSAVPQQQQLLQNNRCGASRRALLLSAFTILLSCFRWQVGITVDVLLFADLTRECHG